MLAPPAIFDVEFTRSLAITCFLVVVFLFAVIGCLFWMVFETLSDLKIRAGIDRDRVKELSQAVERFRLVHHSITANQSGFSLRLAQMESTVSADARAGLARPEEFIPSPVKI